MPGVALQHRRNISAFVRAFFQPSSQMLNLGGHDQSYATRCGLASCLPCIVFVCVVFYGHYSEKSNMPAGGLYWLASHEPLYDLQIKSPRGISCLVINPAQLQRRTDLLSLQHRVVLCLTLKAYLTPTELFPEFLSCGERALFSHPTARSHRHLLQVAGFFWSCFCFIITNRDVIVND